MGTDAEAKASLGGPGLEERPQIRDEPVVAGKELVELPAARDVLILEALGLAFAGRAERPADDLLVDGRELFPHPGEEARDAHETVLDALRARGREREGPAFPREPVVPFGARSLSRDRPERVGKVLLDERDLGLDRELHVEERRPGTAVPGNPSENPGASLLVHQPPGPVDGVHQDAERGILLGRLVRNDRASLISETFGDENDGLLEAETAEEFEDLGLAHLVDRVERVTAFVPRHLRHLHERRTLASRDDGVPDARVEMANRLEKMGYVHETGDELRSPVRRRTNFRSLCYPPGWRASQMNEITLAVRKLARRPAFSLTTLLCLALGIGATTAIGSVIKTLFLESAAVEDLDGLAFFMAMREGVEPFGVSPLEIEAFRDSSRSFRRLGIARTMDGNSVNLTGGERAERVRAAQASAAYFETLGVAPLLGRLFVAEEERFGGPRALLMSHALWTRRFEASPAVVGRVLRVNGEIRTVVGILPERVDLPSKTELWLPLDLDFERLPLDERANHSYMLVGRLEDGVGLDRAETELVAIARDVAAEYPQTNAGWSVALIPFRDLLLGDVQGGMRTLIYALAGAVSLLLVIACVNGAHLFLARCLEQEREIALSAALGASRIDIFRQLFLEGLLLAVGAGVLGSAAALAIVPAFLASSSIHEGAYTNFFRSIEIDGGVLLLALGASLVTAVLFGTIPLVAILGRDPGHTLRSGGRGGSGRSQARLSRLLVVGEVAVSAMLLVGAGLLVRSLAELMKLDLGFRPESMVSAELTLPASEFPGQAERVAFSRRILERARAIPSVVAAGTTTDVPLRLGTWDSRYVIEGTPPPSPGEVPWAAYRAVSPGYLETLGVSLVRGRTFQDADREGAPKVAVVSAELARRALGDADPLGRRIGHPDEIGTESGWSTIVGVVEDVKEDRYNFRIDRPVWYVPYEQVKESGILLNLVLRTRAGSAAVGPEIRSAVKELYPEVVPGELFELEPHVSSVVGAERTGAGVALLLAVLGTILASLGLYGVMAYGVRQRFRELGLRMAVGASPKELSRLVLGDGLRWVGLGLAAGLVGAFLLARLFSSLLFETRPWDPLTYASVGGLFLVVTLAACYFPARRAAATNPVDALRME